MSAVHPLPLNGGFVHVDDYVQSLLAFITSSEIFQKLCGGVHILDFLTKEPDLYNTIIPQDWREWFKLHDVSVILDLLMREDESALERLSVSCDGSTNESQSGLTWRDGKCPPQSLLRYIQSIRGHALGREIQSLDRRKVANSSNGATSLPRHVAVGMKPKKIHEVENFTKYIDDLISEIVTSTSNKITHVVDFGSGQNYLGRALASPPFSKKVVALESKQLNITGAKSMDVTAKLAEKEKIMRNKKDFRTGCHPKYLDQTGDNHTRSPEDCPKPITDVQCQVALDPKFETAIQYIEMFIKNGDLSKVVNAISFSPDGEEGRNTSKPELMVISLHSCGNLLHHGLRSLILNPSVKAIALVGCCYNLVTERLGPPTYKLPSLRISNPRLDQTSSACDPHGFPMSERLATYQHSQGEGIRMNITARMMACQAPQNWTAMDCESFFTRHFYRALLQRILVDRGVVGRPVEICAERETASGSPRGWTGNGPALTIGSLRKACYVSFEAYVRGAIRKLSEDKERGAEIVRRMQGLTDEDIQLYEEKYGAKKKELSIVWSLMAFSASVVEATIVVDRWLYLKEQPEVSDCWVEIVFDYKQSPRNLVVVGIKR